MSIVKLKRRSVKVLGTMLVWRCGAPMLALGCTTSNWGLRVHQHLIKSDSRTVENTQLYWRHVVIALNSDCY